MATALKTLSSLAQNKNVLNFSARYMQIFGYGFKRNNHILHKENPEDKIVMADNGATIVCWHPQPKFPYECSLPLPIKSNEVNKILKTQATDISEMFHFEKPQQQREYLMKTTATTKHRWFPRVAKKYAKKTKPDREFL
ncbi:putative 39S ribosomal protein L42 [Daphnia sinensis]|uniref:Large ribosomal subunit protein mL42 n=1 Tax=Daphnia sinensis TaxID=1820382 RepID=A0AAD5LFN8_9CRUS|nr:putative 39S ribosomal protein L42 [Daphnia sinensis]